MNKFDIVTPEWVREQLKQKGLTNRELAKGVNVDDRQVSRWISGDRNPTASAKAAIYYFLQQKSP